MSDETFDTEYNEISNAYTTGGAGPFAAQLREVIDAIDVSDSLTTPLKLAIENLLQLAAKAVGSAEASVLVRDGNEGGLRFLTAISGVKEELLKLHIPPGK